MKKFLNIHDKQLGYTLKFSAKASKISLAVYSTGEFVVTAPKKVNEDLVELFLLNNSNWIQKKLNLVSSREKVNHDSFKDSKIKALNFVISRLEYFSSIYNFKYNRVTVRDQKTRWGSCSKNKNLSFNYKLLFIPRDLADYVIVHELCHLHEMNHSYKFWALVAKVVPDYLSKRKALKRLVL